MDSGLEQVLFRTLTDKLIEEIGVDTRKQRLDSTAVHSAIRGLARLGILVEATSKCLRELKRTHPQQYSSVDSEIIRKYVDQTGDGCFGDTRPSESRLRVTEAEANVFELIAVFQETECSNLESYHLLRQIFHEQCEVSGAGESSVTVRPPSKTGCDGVINPADPDARYNKHRGMGYHVQIMETYVEDDSEGPEVSAASKPYLITHVAVDPLVMHDKGALAPAFDDTEE